MDHLVYIATNKDRMRYVTLATSSLPIGSGVTESAARTVIGRRAKNSGQRCPDSAAPSHCGRSTRALAFLASGSTCHVATPLS
jgi:hypothetical protein